MCACVFSTLRHAARHVQVLLDATSSRPVRLNACKSLLSTVVDAYKLHKSSLKHKESENKQQLWLMSTLLFTASQLNTLQSENATEEHITSYVNNNTAATPATVNTNGTLIPLPFPSAITLPPLSILAALLRGARDESESVRRTAIEAISSLFHLLKENEKDGNANVPSYLPYCFSLFHDRLAHGIHFTASSSSVTTSATSSNTASTSGSLNSHIATEPSEELRLLLLNLLNDMLAYDISELNTDDELVASKSFSFALIPLPALLSIVCQTAIDAYPDLKYAATKLLSLSLSHPAWKVEKQQVVQVLNDQSSTAPVDTNHTMSDVIETVVIPAPAVNLSSEFWPTVVQIGSFTSEGYLSVLRDLLKGVAFVNMKHAHAAVRANALKAISLVMRIHAHIIAQVNNTTTSTLASMDITQQQQQQRQHVLRVEWSADVLQLVEGMVHDRQVKVRETFVQEVKYWINHSGLASSQSIRLFSALLSCLSDESSSVAQLALTTAEQIATNPLNTLNLETLDRKELNEQSTQYASSPDPLWQTASHLFLSNSQKALITYPFTQSPSLSLQHLVVALLSQLLPHVLTSLTDWQSRTRLKASGLLRSICLISKQHLNKHIELILQTLVKTIRDDDVNIYTQLAYTCHVIGLYTTPVITLQYILKQIQQYSDSNYRLSLLTVMNKILEGQPTKQELFQIIPVFLNTFQVSTQQQQQQQQKSQNNSNSFSLAESTVRIQLLHSFHLLLKTFETQLSAFFSTIFHIVLCIDSHSHEALMTNSKNAVFTQHTQGIATGGGHGSMLNLLAKKKENPEENDESQLVYHVYVTLATVEKKAEEKQPHTNTMSDSAHATPSTSTSSSSELLSNLISRHFLSECELLLGSSSILANPSSFAWNDPTSTPIISSLFQLIRRLLLFASHDLSVFLATLLPLICCSSSTQNEPTLRSDALSLLYHLILSVDASILDISSLTLLLEQCVLPNTVWRAGKVMQSLRLQAFTILHALFHVLRIEKQTQFKPYIDQPAFLSSLFPIFLSNLDDDASEIRMITILLIGQIAQSIPFKLLPPTTTSTSSANEAQLHAHDQLTQLHRALLQRLDDSQDDIRLETIRTFTIIFHKWFPPCQVYDVTDSYYTYLLQCFLLYLDDSNVSIQNGIFAFLKSCRRYHPVVFEKCVKEHIVKAMPAAREKCKILLELAAQDFQTATTAAALLPSTSNSSSSSSSL